MRHLLDTTVLIPFLDGNRIITDLVARLAPEGVSVSIMSYLEVWQGTIDVADPVAAQR